MSHRPATGASDEPMNLVFLTDVEGNFEYMRRFVAISDALDELSMLKDGSLDIQLKEGWRFIFGGDAVDKGHTEGGSIRVVKSLVRLKQKYPKRVTLLLGNRDVNKLRFSSELAADQMQQLEGLPGPEWVPEAKRVTPKMFLTKLTAHKQNVSPEDVTAEQLSVANTMANRVRYILTETMGADGEFERRMEERPLLPPCPVSHALPPTARNYKKGFMELSHPSLPPPLPKEALVRRPTPSPL